MQGYPYDIWTIKFWTVKFPGDICIVESQNQVRATVTVRVTVTYDCPVYDCPDFDCEIKTCNKGTAAPHFLALVYCRQTAGWINMPFGMDYGGTFRPRPHCARWEPSSLIRGTAAPKFRPVSIVAKWLGGLKCHLVRR